MYILDISNFDKIKITNYKDKFINVRYVMPIIFYT